MNRGFCRNWGDGLVERNLGNGRRRRGFAAMVAGAVLIAVGLYGIVASGDVGPVLFSAVTALPVGVLALLGGLDLLSRSTRPARSPGPRVASMEAWLATPQSARHAAKAATN